MYVVAHEPVLRQPGDQGLAGHRRPRPLGAEHRAHRPGQRRRVPVGHRPAPAARPRRVWRGPSSARRRPPTTRTPVAGYVPAGRGRRRAGGCDSRRAMTQATPRTRRRPPSPRRGRLDGSPPWRPAAVAVHADMDAAPDVRGGRHRRLVPRPARRRPAPPGPQRVAPLGRRRPAGQAGPVPRGAAHPRDAAPANLPAGRALPDALRRGLPRPDGHGVPPVLALRAVARHLRVDAPAPREVRDGRPASSCGGRTTSAPRATSRCPCAPWRSSRDASTRRRRARRRASGSMSRPARRSARTTFGHVRCSPPSPHPARAHSRSTRPPASWSSATTTGGSRRSTWRPSAMRRTPSQRRPSNRWRPSTIRSPTCSSTRTVRPWSPPRATGCRRWT